jgi:hypothetical protein
MELLIGAIAILVIAYIVFKPKKAEETTHAPVVESAPYKVPEPAATTPIPLVAEQASEAMVESVAPAKKKPAAKKAPAAKKPAAKKTTKPKASE